MDQLSLFDAAAEPAGDPIDGRPGHTYRVNKNGTFTVTATIDGVGRVSATHRHLWPAVQDVEAKITAALAARPQEMF